MEKDKKVVVLDNDTALVIRENTEGNFLMSQHYNWLEYDQDSGHYASGTSHSLYTLSKRQASILMKKEPSSKIFQYTLSKVKEKNIIDVWGLKGEARKVCDKILDDGNKVAQPAMEERHEYLNQEREKMIQEKERAKEQAKDALSQKFLDYVKGFKIK